MAQLSAIQLSPAQAAAMQTDLSNLLDYVAQLDEVATEGVTPTYQPHDLESVTRADTVIDYDINQRELLKNAPRQADGYIVVPRVLE